MREAECSVSTLSYRMKTPVPFYHIALVTSDQILVDIKNYKSYKDIK